MLIRAKHNCKSILLASFSLFLLSGCSDSWMEFDPWPSFGGGDKDDAPKIAQAPPPDPLQNIAPLQMKQGGTLGAMGLNLETYFAPDIQDPIERTRRLERALIALQKDLQIMTPSSQRLAGLEPKIKETIAEVEKQKMQPPTALNPATAIPAQTAMAPKPIPTATNATPVQPGSRNVSANGGKAIVSGIRVGEHPDKIRIVFDVTAKTGYKADLDNGENLLVVELPNARWQTPTRSENFGKMPLLRSYKVDDFNNGQGNIFVLQLKKATEIIKQGKFPALSGTGERIVIDLRK